MSEARINEAGKEVEAAGDAVADALHRAGQAAGQGAEKVAQHAADAWTSTRTAGREAYEGVSTRINGAVDVVRGSSMGDLVEDLRIVVRRKPVLAALIAFGAGYALARYVDGEKTGYR